YRPFGFGGDMLQIKFMGLYKDSLSLDGAISAAANKLSIYNDKVLSYAGEIVAYLNIVNSGPVAGSMIDIILERARKEVEEEYQIEIIIPEQTSEREEFDTEETEELIAPKLVLMRDEQGNIVEEIMEVKVCELCGGRDGHMEGCELSGENEYDYSDELTSGE
ncbi:MAG: hypothetical protein ABIO02_00530, partial [Patescibacteria group bacterium]